ncbi:MAG: type II toxin-antitoxin system Phd/YefM family antitoxin [Phycisphaeraceae bacterium]|nr:type II toxin-antitoxin system Phd/YefM family antitoxin [Phycisphaeraceae bacterium]MBX3406065.1 type II toxin-antitoxin system Phd/YefM family antitoxin [Phycisphaeraceae bacterium]
MIARDPNSVGTFEAKTHLSDLLDRVAKGESITITRHGIPVARLVPPQQRDPLAVQAAIDRLLELRRHHSLGGLSVKELRDEGRP